MHFNSLLHTRFCTISLALPRLDDRVQVSLSDEYSHFRLDSSRFCTVSLALVHNKAPMKCRLNLAFAHFYRLMHAFVHAACQPNVRFLHTSSSPLLCMLLSCMHSEIVNERSWWLDTNRIQTNFAPSQFVAGWLLGCLLNSFVSHFIISSCGTAQRPCIRDMFGHAACN